MTNYDYKKSADADNADVSKVIRQYLDIKLKHLDKIVLFRIGEFYETYFEDAFSLALECEILLTKKDIGGGKIAPMAGVPVNSIDIYIKKLISSHHKIALCEQSLDEKCPKTGLVKRKIIRTFSAGTLCDSEFLDSGANNYICAVYEAEKEFGLSYCDVSTGEFFITQGTLEQILGELSKINPSELLAPIKTRKLVPFTVVEDEKADLNEKILSQYTPTLVPRDYFSNTLVKNAHSQYELGNCCANAILKYVYQTQQEFTPKLNNIQSYDISEYLLVDENSRKNLELLKNLSDSKKYGSLFWAIDNTKTPMGKRLLRNWIVQPLMDIERISKRQDAVEELLKSDSTLDKITTLLKECYDISRISTKISNGTIGTKDFLALKTTLSKIEELENILQNTKNPLLNFAKESSDYEKLKDFSNILEQTISQDATGPIKEGGIIKAGVNSELDYLKSQIDECDKWFQTFKTEEQKNIKGLKVTNNRVIGYYIEIPVAQMSKVPKNYLCKQTLSNCARYTTKELKGFEEKINILTLRANELEYDIFLKLKEYSKELVADIRKLSQSLAQLDVLCSFAIYAKSGEFKKPEFVQDESFEIKSGKHPSAQRLCSEFIPNDTFLNEKNFILLTGPNMIGKSTYLKQNALLSILAQMGSFVPAASMCVGILDKIFTRMGSVDELVKHNSTFMVEMLELGYILKNATSKSLILLDEVGKNTSTKDGVAIAQAASEYILENIGAKTIFATHYHKLSCLKEKYPRVENYMIGADFSRKIEKGFLDNSYGIKIAKLANLPEEVIKKAEKYIAL